MYKIVIEKKGNRWNNIVNTSNIEEDNIYWAPINILSEIGDGYRLLNVEFDNDRFTIEFEDGVTNFDYLRLIEDDSNIGHYNIAAYTFDIELLEALPLNNGVEDIRRIFRSALNVMHDCYFSYRYATMSLHLFIFWNNPIDLLSLIPGF